MFWLVLDAINDAKMQQTDNCFVHFTAGTTGTGTTRLPAYCIAHMDMDMLCPQATLSCDLPMWTSAYFTPSRCDSWNSGGCKLEFDSSWFFALFILFALFRLAISHNLPPASSYFFHKACCSWTKITQCYPVGGCNVIGCTVLCESQFIVLARL